MSLLLQFSFVLTPTLLGFHSCIFLNLFLSGRTKHSYFPYIMDTSTSLSLSNWSSSKSIQSWPFLPETQSSLAFFYTYIYIPFLRWSCSLPWLENLSIYWCLPILYLHLVYLLIVIFLFPNAYLLSLDTWVSSRNHLKFSMTKMRFSILFSACLYLP